MLKKIYRMTSSQVSIVPPKAQASILHILFSLQWLHPISLFNTHSNNRKCYPQNGLFHTIKEILTELCSGNDVQKAIKQHASGKSNGSDGIQINPHTIADFQLLRHLLKILQLIEAQNSFFQAWLFPLSIAEPTKERGSIALCNNRLGSSFPATAGKGSAPVVLFIGTYFSLVRVLILSRVRQPRTDKICWFELMRNSLQSKEVNSLTWL